MDHKLVEHMFQYARAFEKIYGDTKVLISKLYATAFARFDCAPEKDGVHPALRSLDARRNETGDEIGIINIRQTFRELNLSSGDRENMAAVFSGKNIMVSSLGFVCAQAMGG